MKYFQNALLLHKNALSDICAEVYTRGFSVSGIMNKGWQGST